MRGHTVFFSWLLFESRFFYRATNICRIVYAWDTMHLSNIPWFWQGTLSFPRNGPTIWTGQRWAHSFFKWMQHILLRHGRQFAVIKNCQLTLATFFKHLVFAKSSCLQTASKTSLRSALKAWCKLRFACRKINVFWASNLDSTHSQNKCYVDGLQSLFTRSSDAINLIIITLNTLTEFHNLKEYSLEIPLQKHSDFKSNYCTLIK